MNAEKLLPTEQTKQLFDLTESDPNNVRTPIFNGAIAVYLAIAPSEFFARELKSRQFCDGIASEPSIRFAIR